MDWNRVVLGVDFGATNLKALIVDESGQVFHRFIEPSEPARGPEATLKRLVALVGKARTTAESAGLRLTDIGIGVCGPVDHLKGEIVESPLLPGWERVAVRDVVQKEVGLPVHLDNDANLAVLGEWWLGAGERRKVVAGLTLGTGVGGGLIIDGRIYRGAFGFGAEFGHISVAQDPRCPCGGRGCLGRVASATDTLARYQELAGNKGTSVRDLVELAKLVEDNDQWAIESVSVSAQYLAKAILILINCLNPDVFILAGGMALLGNVLLDPIRESIRSSTFKVLAEGTRIVSATLGLYSGCFGSSWLALSADRVLPHQETLSEVAG